MGRRIVASAALVALMVVLSACACHGATKSAPGSTVCVPPPCVHMNDCSACYRSETDRDMGRLRDDLPYGGCCKGCEVSAHHHTVYKDPCGPSDGCKGCDH